MCCGSPGPRTSKATIAQTGTVRRVLLGDGKARAPARARWVRPLASGRAARCETRGQAARQLPVRPGQLRRRGRRGEPDNARPAPAAGCPGPSVAQARPGPRQKAQHLAIETAPGSTAAGPESKPAARKAPVVPTPPAGRTGPRQQADGPAAPWQPRAVGCTRPARSLRDSPPGRWLRSR